MWMGIARGFSACWLVAAMVALFLSSGDAMAQAPCPSCNPASAHSMDMCRIGNPETVLTRHAGGSMSIGSVLAQGCALYAQQHSNGPYVSSWDSCTPRVPAPNTGAYGGPWGSFSVDGTLRQVDTRNGNVLSSVTGGWSLATCSCEDRVNPNAAGLGNDGQCYCKGNLLWDDQQRTCVAVPVLIALKGQTVTRASPVGPVLPQLAVVTQGGQALAGRQVSVAIEGQGALNGVTDSSGSFTFTYVPPRVATNDNVIARCSGCSNTASHVISVEGPGTQICPAEPGDLLANPIMPATGEKVQLEADFTDGSAHALDFGRSYRSQDGWRHSFDARVILRAAARLVRLGDGSLSVFTQSNGAWVGDNADRLVEHAGGYTFQRSTQDRRYEFDVSGLLLAVVQPNGWTMSLAYSGGRLGSVTNAFGRSLLFTHDAQGRLANVALPGGGVIGYAWEGTNLTAVTYEDGSTRRYHYEDPRHPAALTGITDQAGRRIGTYSYDEAGRAIGTRRAALPGYSVSYGQSAAANPARQGSLYAGSAAVEAAASAITSALVTDPLGTTRDYRFAGGSGLTRVQVSSGPFDGVDWATRELGANLLPVEERDFLGVITQSAWEAQRKLLATRTQAVGRPEERTVQTYWHETLRLPLLVTEPGRRTAYTYDERGNLLTQAVTDTATGQVRQWSWTYNAQGLVATQADPRGAVWAFGYDAAGNRTSVVNPLGQAVSLSYDAAGRVATQADANGLVTSYAYDARGRVVSLVRGGEASSFSYTPDGLLATALLPNGYAVSYTHDAAARLVAVQDNRGASVQYTLDAMGNRVREEVKDALGNLALVTSRAVNAFNRVVTVQGATGQTTQLGRDANGELVSETDPLNQTTRQALDALRRPTATTFPDNTSAAQAWNALDQVTQVRDPKGVQTGYAVNAFGEVMGESSPDTGQVTYQRDAGGNVVAATDAKGNTVQITRDLLGRPLEVRYAADHVAHYTYDAAGNVTHIEDRSGETVYQRDAQGRVLSKAQAVNDNPSSPTQLQVDYAYTGGELAGITYPSGLKVTYRRTAGRVTGIDVQAPGANKPVVPFVTGLVHTPLGQPKAWAWSNGQAAGRSFDADGRMTGTEFAGFTYDAAGRVTSITQNLWASSTATGTVSLYTTPLTWSAAYDSRNRVTGFARAGAETRYTYDANSNRLSGSVTTTSDVDLDGDLGEDDFSKTLVQALAVPADSNRLMGFTQTLAKVRDGQTRSVVVTPVAYTVDENGAVTSDGLRTFEYDAAQRLAKVRIGQGEEAARVAYLHNALGQRVFKSEVGAEQTAPSEEELGVDFVTWLKQRFGWLFSRAQATTSVGTAFVYGDGAIPGYALLGEYDNGGASGRGRTEYIWLPTEGGGLPVPVGMLRGGRFYAIHSDHLATPRLVTDDAGKPVWQWPYSAFGDNKPTGVLAATANPRQAVTNVPVLLKATRPAQELELRYPGQYHDAETGTFYNTLRDSMDPAMGRYRQGDPIGMEGGLNRFVYVEGNALVFVDPTGLQHYVRPRRSGWPEWLQPTQPNPHCVTAECVAGLLPPPVENRTNEQISKDISGRICKWSCERAVSSVTGGVSEICRIGFVEKYVVKKSTGQVCGLVCE
jgi:RHS repeat-associated protein